jgi:histone H3/H4
MNNQRASKQHARNTIERFWVQSIEKAESEPLDYKDVQLPLARIKRLMKVEEEVKMVASEVPILFSKVAEKFIEELTLRAWLNTEENKRRILQKNDLSAAVKTSDMFDFLIYIVPRTELGQTIEHFADPPCVGHKKFSGTKLGYERMGGDSRGIPEDNQAFMTRMDAKGHPSLFNEFSSHKR